MSNKNLTRKCEIKHIKQSKKVGQEINFPLSSLVIFFLLLLNVKSINYTHTILLCSLILCSESAYSAENELGQASLSIDKGPAGHSRLARIFPI